MSFGSFQVRASFVNIECSYEKYATKLFQNPIFNDLHLEFSMFCQGSLEFVISQPLRSCRFLKLPWTSRSMKAEVVDRLGFSCFGLWGLG